MAVENLDNVASEAMPQASNAQTADTTPTASEPVENNGASVEQASKAEGKQSRYQTLNKSFGEYRQFSDRKINELTQKIAEYEKKFGTYAPLEAYLPQLQKVLEAKKQAELQEQLKANPIETQKQLMEQMLNERLAPLQQQAVEAQNQQFVTESINGLKQQFGEAAFNEVAPVMGQILEGTKQQFGPEVADLLARNPQHLFMTAFGHLAYSKIMEFNQSQQKATANKQQLAAKSAGVSRPNTRVNQASTNQADIMKDVESFLLGNN